MIPKSLAVKPLNQAASSVPMRIEELANRQVVTDLTQRGPSNEAVTPINPGRVASIKKLAPKYTISILNTDDADQDCYLFNLDTYKENATEVQVTYSDGFDGKLINKLIADLDGLLIYGFNITGYDADGVKSDAVVNASNPVLLSYIGYGERNIPTPIDVAGAERNTQYKDGLLTIKTQFVLNCLSQMLFRLGAGEKLQLVFFLQPMQD